MNPNTDTVHLTSAVQSEDTTAREPHHAPGSRVLVMIGRDGRTAPGVVRQTVTALDRDYRVTVDYPDGREWILEAAPECVLPGASA